MIGQKELLYLINDQVAVGGFPRFSILVGQEGSGKKTLAMETAKMMGCEIAFIEPKIDAIREMIKNAYQVHEKSLYVITDGIMSTNAKNAMLKISEETPNNAYIMMLVSDINTVLDTLKSRAGVYFMQPYTPDEILEYAQIGKEEVQNCDIVVDLCETPQDVNKLYDYGVEEFYSFVEKTVEHIANVSSANAFKMAEKIAFKPIDTDKYDMALFLRAFKAVCGKELKMAVANKDLEGQMWYSAGIKVVADTLNQLHIVGINKGALFDIFILNIRREWA